MTMIDFPLANDKQLFRPEDFKTGATTLFRFKLKSGFAVGTSGFFQQVGKKALVIQGKVSSDWFLVKPIVVEVAKGEQGEFVLSNSSLDVYGVGSSIQEAKNDMLSMLIESYEDLIESEDELSSYLAELLYKLRSILKPV